MGRTGEEEGKEKEKGRGRGREGPPPLFRKFMDSPLCWEHLKNLSQLATHENEVQKQVPFPHGSILAGRRLIIMFR